ncbi:MAG TPA: undecaprenyl/decaprenyl-phosphate alpha-N-acetylglucosaminyl 1-phosphate transferase [Prolixibacteraceae bacterium]|jgi:UDP-N-acetylmuramyl pentapeptide phosphotransferase/UDP-N-acetylglucosamine-1-phosphate transferase|nr:undecaprenyl/decaprenyl-phosphate alpha-N-acetylglucosaminyl 1-phosphate transferase [Prolixibacteraceae bacterium]
MVVQINIFLSFVISFTIVFFVIPKIIDVSRIKKLFDVPNHRSAAKQIVPTLGGIAIYAGFRLSQIVSLDSFNTNELKYMSAGVMVMFLMGLNDDIIGISAKTKLFIQVLVASYVVIFGGYQIENLHGLFGINEIEYFTGIILSIFVIVGIINSLNLIDGIDGLASGIGIIITGVFGVLFLNIGDYLYAITCFSLTGSLVAFFLYNVFGNTNKIFMGDTGSLILGIVVALITIHFIEVAPVSNMAVNGSTAIALAVIIVPVIDTLRVFAIRISQKRSPFSPDMNHIHHNLLKLTGSHLTSSSIIIAVNGLIILVSFLVIDQIGSNLLFCILLISGFTLASIPAYILKWQDINTSIKKEDKSIFALSIFTKKSKD